MKYIVAVRIVTSDEDMGMNIKDVLDEAISSLRDQEIPILNVKWSLHLDK